MVDYETTEELLENFFNPEKRLLLQEKWFKEDLRERFNKEIEEKVAQAKLEAEREHEKVERSILLMLSQGIKAEIIAKILELPIEQIGAIQEKYKDNNPLKKYLNGAA